MRSFVRPEMTEISSWRNLMICACNGTKYTFECQSVEFMSPKMRDRMPNGSLHLRRLPKKCWTTRSMALRLAQIFSNRFLDNDSSYAALHSDRAKTKGQQKDKLT